MIAVGIAFVVAIDVIAAFASLIMKDFVMV